MYNIVIFGGPGSGKGTQSKKIADRYGLYHISTGDVLRDHISRGTEIGNTARQYIDNGQLIPDSLMVEILADLLRQKPQETARGVIFDGFPRTIAQAEILDDMLRHRGAGIDHVVGLEVGDDTLVERMLRRGLDSGRADDNIDTIRKRLHVYHEQTQPLKEYYAANGRYRHIDGEKTEQEVFDQISSHLDKK